MMKRIFSAVLLVLMGLAVELCAATPLSGVIRSPNGQRMPRVKVLTFAPLMRQTKFPDANMSTQRYEVMSDDKGFFRLPDHGRVVYFTHAEQQRPVTKILPLTATNIEVAMEDAAPTRWKVPLCKATSGEARNGVAFKVVVPDYVLVKKGVQFDLDIYAYGYQIHDGNFESMVNWQDSTASHPREEILLGAKEFTERVWVARDRFGYDVRGQGRDGKFWRFVSYRWGAISYQSNSLEAAKVFDDMIDGMCFDNEDGRKYPKENF
jgi:hypothetical protein